MEEESSEDSFESAQEEDKENGSDSKDESQEFGLLEDQLAEEILTRIQKVSPKLEQNEKQWIVENYHLFENAEKMFGSEEGKKFTRRQIKSLKPILNDVIAKRKKRSRSCLLLQHVQCEQEIADWICENCDKFTSNEELIEREELDDLSQNQLDTLENVLATEEFKDPHKVCGKKQELIELKEQIHQKTGLEKSLCHWIADTWFEDESLLNLLKNDKLQNIPRKQLKELKAILQSRKHKTSGTPAVDLRRVSQEFIDFARSSDFDISDSMAIELTELRGPKCDISKMVKVLRESNLELREKFEVLNFLLYIPQENIKNGLLEGTQEYLALTQEFKNLATQLKIDKDLSSGLQQKLSSFQSVRDFDQFEDLTKKQAKILKERLRLPVNNLVELKHSLGNNGSQNDLNDVASCSQISFSSLAENANFPKNIYPSASSHQSTSLDEFLEDTLQKSSTIVSSVSDLEQGSSKQIVTNEYRVDMSQNESKAISLVSSNAPSDVEKSVPNDSEKQTSSISKKVSETELLNTTMEAITYPLITCKDISQGDNVVEKFSVRADQVEKLCNFDEECPRFYKDVSSGLMIDFAALNDYKIAITGLFGRSKNAKKFLRTRLDDESLSKFEECLQFEESGMFFIANKDLTDEKVIEGFLYFYSKGDEDYDNANPKSRSVHFFRYVTQLTKNIVLLFDETDHQLMIERPPEETGQKNRCRKYQIKELESQKEQVCFTKVGSLSVCWEEKPHVFASNAGLLIVKTSEKTTSTGIWRNQFIETISKFKSLFSLSHISEDADICESFMEEYIREIHTDRYDMAKKLWESMEKAMREGETSKKLSRNLDFALALCLYEKSYESDFCLLNAFFLNFLPHDSSNQMKKIRDEWNECSKMEFDMSKSLVRRDEVELLSYLESYCQNLSPSYFFLRIVLEKKTGKTPPSNRTLRELIDWAKSQQLTWKGKFWKMFQFTTKHEQPVLEKEFVRENLQVFMDECKSDHRQFQILISRTFSNLQNFSHNWITQGRGLSKHESYKLERLDRLVEKKITDEKSTIIKECFFDIRQELQPLGERAEIASSEKDELVEDSEKLIKSVTKCNTNFGGKFNVHYSIKSKDQRKTLLEINKVSTRKEPAVSSSSVPCLNYFTEGSSCSLEVPLCEVVCVYSIDASLVLLLMNTGETSVAEIRSISTSIKSDRINFGKRISLNDFDVSKRLLCLYSERPQETDIHLYQFSENFKSHTTFGSYDLKARYSMDALQSISLQYSSKYLWVLERNTGRLLRLNNKNGNNTSPDKLANLKQTTGKIRLIQMSPNAQCIFLTNENHETFPLMTGTCNLLPKTEDPLADRYLFIQPEFRETLLAQKTADGLNFQSISILGAQQEMKLHETSTSREEFPNSSSADIFKEKKEHWIRNFLWMFVKFPCENLFENGASLQLSAVYESMPQGFEEAVQASLQNVLEHLKSTKKPSSLLNASITFHPESLNMLRSFKHVSTIEKMGDFVQKLICFTPLQIARCQGNEFLILENGQPLSLENVEDVFDLKEKVDLGLFEAIFNQWTGPVKVVSSMGKQTTGKSYLLNHLMGSSFNISGTRCTDGCWMTVEVVQDCLYVILDFEGLGSFERTDQDDMLLSLFNSSLSTMTLFKTEQRLDRDTDQLFSKFNLGSDQLRGTDKIFQGTFMIIVKDVAESDIEDIRKEFVEKINVLLQKEKQNNFISKLYQGGFQINPFSPFQTRSFYNDISSLREEILATEPLFTDGHVFMDLMKLMLSKLAISDFTPVDRQQIDSRIKYLKNHMSNALKYGQLSDEFPKRPEYSLTLLDKKNERIPTRWSLKLPEVNLQPFEMDDNDFSFVESSFMGIVRTFSGFLPQQGSNVTQWRGQLELFLEECLNNRCQRVGFWIHENVALWKKQDSSDYDDILCALNDSFTLEKSNLRRQMKFCDEKCFKCFVKCTRIVGHKSEHLCSTNHLCTENCLYCGEDTRPCKHPLGHENDHLCKDIEHFCGKECSFNVKNNCTNECALMSNHEGDHKCSLKVHICDAKCSLESCTSACQIDCLVEHEVHKCSKEQCMADCCVKNCRNICSAKDHFHGFSELSANFRRQQNLDESVAPFCMFDGTQLFLDDHFCGNEHPCGQDCEEDGYCEVSVEKQFEEREETFEGLRSTFKYKRKFVQVGKKLACLQKIAPFEKEHEGDHSCTTKAKVHFCKDKCPTCENICDKPYDHVTTEDNLHHTAHGNMTKCYFICNQEDFNVGDHKYTIGEEAVAEFCHMFCNSLGRGHIHVIECPGKCEDQFDIENDHRRHQSCVYGPDKELPKDEIWHSAYWTSIGFQDPCTGTEIEVFEKCPFYCSAPNHVADNSDETEDFRSYCLLDLWHAPVMEEAQTVRDDSVTVSKDGHLFGCYHDTKTFHWVLVLDKSGSMSGQPWQDVMESAKSFMLSRGSVSTTEKYSIVIYGNYALVGEEFQDVANFNPQSMTTLDAGGGTDFSVALSTADEVISRHLDENCIPVLVFMSDGDCYNGDAEMAELARKYLVEHKLKVYTIGFGSVDFDKLKQLAYRGGGKFIECTEAIDLKHTFIQIASEAPANVGVTSCK